MNVTSISQIEDIFRKMSNSLEFENLLTIEANRVLSNIKKRHGVYPDDVHWAPLKQETIARKKRGDTPLLETGDLMNSYNIKTMPQVRSIGSDDDKAVWMEKGTVDIPSRPVVLPEARKQEIEFRNNFNAFINLNISRYIK